MISELYRHWPKYQALPSQEFKDVALDSSIESQLWEWVIERMSIYHKKAAGLPFPWTEDELLKKNHFTHPYRELDKTTIALHKLIMPVAEDLELTLLNFAYFRWVGLPQIVDQIGLLSFDEAHLKQCWEKFNTIEGVRFTSAYNSAIAGILSTGCKDRQEFIFKHLPSVIPALAKVLTEQKEADLQELTEIMAPMFGFNARFMCVEILMDMGYQFPELIDENKGMFIGPGAVPSIKLLNPKADTQSVLKTLYKNQPVSDIPYLKVNGENVLLTVANLEGVCCEFRKYYNLKNSMGLKGEKPRIRLYKR